MSANQITSPAGPSKVSVSAKNGFLTSHIVATVAGTEYPIIIPSGTKSFEIAANNNAKLIFSNVSGGTSSSDGFPRFPGFGWKEELLTGTSALNIYVMSNKDNTIIQILTWS